MGTLLRIQIPWDIGFSSRLMFLVQKMYSDVAVQALH